MQFAHSHLRYQKYIKPFPAILNFGKELQYPLQSVFNRPQDFMRGGVDPAAPTRCLLQVPCENETQLLMLRTRKNKTKQEAVVSPTQVWHIRTVLKGIRTAPGTAGLTQMGFHHTTTGTSYLGLVQVHAIHGQFLGIIQVVELGLCWCLAPGTKQQHMSLQISDHTNTQMLL